MNRSILADAIDNLIVSRSRAFASAQVVGRRALVSEFDDLRARVDASIEQARRMRLEPFVARCFVVGDRDGDEAALLRLCHGSSSITYVRRIGESDDVDVMVHLLFCKT
jgi:hypothetical protein